MPHSSTKPIRSTRRLRLFWLIVSGFALTISLTVCGMVGFVGLVLVGQVPGADIRTGLSETTPAYAVLLTDYYIANGRSWAGVERRLETPPFAGTNNLYGYTITDRNGNLIAGMRPDPTPRTRDGGSMLWNTRPVERVALSVNGEQVGFLVAQPIMGLQNSMDDRMDRRQPSFLRSFWHNFLLVGSVVGTLLFGLAIVFARRITSPLRQLTAASEALAAGKRNVRVPSARVRELDDLADSFNRMAESLNTADQQRRQMTADIAHELRTPLSIIRGRLEGMQDGIYQATPDQIEALVNETTLLERLVEDLRLLALADAGRLPLYREPCDPYELLEGAASAFAHQASAQHVQIHIQSSGSLPAIDVDPQRIAQVLANLMSNALHHTAAGGSITLSARAAANTVELAVEDSGSGIAASDLPHVFDRFWRADHSRTRGAGGAGLGLAIVKQLVEAQGGRVEATSPAGARFAITLPCATNGGTPDLTGL